MEFKHNVKASLTIAVGINGYGVVLMVSERWVYSDSPCEVVREDIKETTESDWLEDYVCANLDVTGIYDIEILADVVCEDEAPEYKLISQVRVENQTQREKRQ